MTNPARRHFQRVMAAKAAAKHGAAAPMTGDQHQLMLASLIEDRRRLKDIQSVERKIEAKREMLPKYEAYVQGVLEAGQGAQDDVLMTLMVWHFDIGDLEAGLRIAEYALKHGLNPPDQYQRSTAALVAEEVATEALRQLQADETCALALLTPLDIAQELTRDADMHDQVRAKLHKALGYAIRAAGQGDAAGEWFRRALEHLNRAVQLDDRVGVKKDIERLERELKNAADQAKT